MRKSLITALVLMGMIALLAVPAHAKGRRQNRSIFKESIIPHNTGSVKLDAPNIVKLPWNLSLGLEGGKTIATDLFHKADDGVRWIEADRGYFAMFKITWNGTLLDFSK